MTPPQEEYKYEFFNVTFPAQYVAHVEIARAEKMNAFKEVMWQNLRLIFQRLSHSPSIRSIVLTGAGDRAFTSGLDVQAAAVNGPLSAGQQEQGAVEMDAARKAFHLTRYILDFQACISEIEKCEKPVICVLHGVCFGLAMDIALACDIRLSTPSTRFSIKEIDIGLAADIGTLSRLPHSGISHSWVKDVCLTARIFSGEEALRVGLVSELYSNKKEAVAKALEKATLMASKSPVALMGTKELLNYSRDRSVEEGLRYTAVWNAAMLQTEDVGESMKSGMEKRKGTFSKL